MKAPHYHFRPSTRCAQDMKDSAVQRAVAPCGNVSETRAVDSASQGFAVSNPRLRMVALAVAVLLPALMVSGCSRDASDLNRYIEQVKARPGTGIEPIPSLRPHVAFVYPGHERSPFDSSVIAQPVPEPEGIAGTVDIDFDRPREFLEQFPLDALAMVGSLEQDGGRFALVRTPDRTVQRVRVGNWMGQNFGRIVAITPNTIELVEVVPDAFGGFVERDNTIRLVD